MEVSEDLSLLEALEITRQKCEHFRASISGIHLSAGKFDDILVNSSC